MNPEALYQRLNGLLLSSPVNELYSPMITPDAKIWLGRVFAVVNEAGLILEATQLTMLSDELVRTGATQRVSEIFNVLYRALGVLELLAPANSSGAFIHAGSAFDALAAVGKVLSSAKQRVRIVDPYMDEIALTDFAVLLNEGIQAELLTDCKGAKPSFEPAVRRFVEQHGSRRPVYAKLSPARELHDRLIIVDGTTVWTLTQSLNAFASRSPATIVRIDGEASNLKIAAYDQFWAAAEPIN